MSERCGVLCPTMLGPAGADVNHRLAARREREASAWASASTAAIHRRARLAHDSGCCARDRPPHTACAGAARRTRAVTGQRSNAVTVPLPTPTALRYYTGGSRLRVLDQVVPMVLFAAMLFTRSSAALRSWAQTDRAQLVLHDRRLRRVVHDGHLPCVREAVLLRTPGLPPGHDPIRSVRGPVGRQRVGVSSGPERR
jgi:hypothetical protein